MFFQVCNFLKKRLQPRCFPDIFGKFIRAPFLQNTSGRLLLKGIFHFDNFYSQHCLIRFWRHGRKVVVLSVNPLWDPVIKFEPDWYELLGLIQFKRSNEVSVKLYVFFDKGRFRVDIVTYMNINFCYCFFTSKIKIFYTFKKCMIKANTLNCKTIALS